MKRRHWLGAVAGMAPGTAGCLSRIVRKTPFAPAEAAYYDSVAFDAESTPTALSYSAVVTQPNIHNATQPLTIGVAITNSGQSDLRITKYEFGHLAHHEVHDFHWRYTTHAGHVDHEEFDPDAKLWRKEDMHGNLAGLASETIAPGQTGTGHLRLYHCCETPSATLPDTMPFEFRQPVIGSGMHPEFRLRK